MNTASLASLSLNKVVTNIWWNCGAVEALGKASPSFIKAYEKFLLRCEPYLQQIEQDKKPYYTLLESVLRQVLSLEHVPQKFKTKIAMTLIKLEHDVTDFVLDLMELLNDTSRNVNNVVYCINKLWITNDCHLDRSETILQILEHSYLLVDLDPRAVGLYCCIRPYMLYGVLEHLEMWKIKRPTKIDEVIEHIQSNQILGLWKDKATRYARASNGEFHPNRAQVFNYMAVNAPLDVLKYFCKRLKKVHRPTVIPTALVSLLLSKKESPRKIVYLISKMPQKTWLKILVRYHENVFRVLFASPYSEYCVKFFKQLCDNDHLDIARRMLFMSVHMLWSPVYKNVYVYMDAVSQNCQETLLTMWCHAPDSLKRSLGSDLHPSLNCLIDRYEYNILRVLINDSAFSSKQKDDIHLHIASIKVLEYYHHWDDKEFMDILNNMDLDKLKKVLCARTEFRPVYDWLEVKYMKNMKSDIKKDLMQDRSFMVQALSVKSLLEKENAAHDFLLWCYNCCGFSVSELWVVDIYKNYLLEMTKLKRCPSDYLFRVFHVDDDKEAEIKKLLREDIEFINKLLGNFMVPNFCNIQALTKCLFVKNQYAEEEVLLQNYCLSEAGLRQIHSMLETDYYSEDLYIKYGLSSRIERYLEFVENWIIPYQKTTHKGLIEKLTTILSNLDIVEQKVSNASKLLPSESVECNKMITEANHRIFMKLMVNSSIHNVIIGINLLNYIKKGITESLTEFSLSL